MAVTRIPLPKSCEMSQADDRLDLSLAETELPVRTVNALEEQGIFTVRDLLGCTPNWLLRIPNIGEKTLESMYAALERLGFCRAAAEPECHRDKQGEKRRFTLLRD